MLLLPWSKGALSITALFSALIASMIDVFLLVREASYVPRLHINNIDGLEGERV